MRLQWLFSLKTLSIMLLLCFALDQRKRPFICCEAVLMKSIGAGPSSTTPAARRSTPQAASCVVRSAATAT